MSKPNSKIYLPILFCAAFALGFLLGKKSDSLQFPSSNGKQKLIKLLDLIDREYVDVVNTDSIVAITVNGILEKLDPHSVYIPKINWQK